MIFFLAGQLLVTNARQKRAECADGYLLSSPQHTLPHTHGGRGGKTRNLGGNGGTEREDIVMKRRIQELQEHLDSTDCISPGGCGHNVRGS